MRRVDLDLESLYDIECCSSSSTRFAIVIAKSEHSMRRVPDDDHIDSQSDVHSLYQVLPVEDDIFSAPSLTPHIEDFETIWQNSALKTTIGDPPLYLCLPDYELTTTMTTFFDTITELLSVPQTEFVRICWIAGYLELLTTMSVEPQHHRIRSSQYHQLPIPIIQSSNQQQPRTLPLRHLASHLRTPTTDPTRTLRHPKTSRSDS
jgi:hypothetical protein